MQFEEKLGTGRAPSLILSAANLRLGDRALLTVHPQSIHREV